MYLSKKICAVIFVLMTAVFYFYSQDTSSANAQGVAQTEVQSASDSQAAPASGGINGFSEDNESYFGSNQRTSTNSSSTTSSRRGLTGTLVKIIVFLVLIVAAIYGLMWFFRRKGNTQKSDDDYLRRVSTLSLGPGKSVEVVTLIDRAFLIGVTDQNINLISEITDEQLIQAMNLDFDKRQNTKKPMSFSDVLQKFMPGGPKDSGNIYSDTEKKVDSISRFLKK